jgi:hypothetical protein
MIFRVVNSAHLFGQTVQNVIHFSKTDAVWPSDANSLALAIRDVWLGGAHGIRWIQTSTCVWSLVQVYDAGSPSLSPISLTISVAGNETSFSDALPPYEALILRIRADAFGKHGRGRVYIPGVTVGTFAAGVLSSSAITALSPILAQLTAGFITSGGTGFSVGIAPRNSPVDFHLADRFEVAPTSGVQRRRNIGIGI